ncbi:LysR family transcriptional regulator [Clostridium sp. MCC353]|uniref:LysR family transcriptional regulator n=1 Tax=Clostridium sp. MCC353 TaxID=2592646 RepID=UPI001C009A63|nr:LysR family transcriptional regulator [Clostridium sp. MCC353]
MTFEQLSYAVAVAQEKNISKAAERLYISQSALTKSLNRLEEELGIKIFDRNVVPVRLTFAGECYIEKAKQLLSIQSAMNRELEEIMSFRKGRIRVGMGPGRNEFWTPHILPEFTRTYPEVEVQIVLGGSKFLEQELLNGHLDMSFQYLPVISEDLTYTMITQERLLLAVPYGHPVLEGKILPDSSVNHPLSLPPDALNGQTFLFAPEGHGITQCTRQIFARYHIQPGQIRKYTNCDLIYALACEGMGMAFVPDTCALYPAYYKKPVFCTVDNPPFTMNLAAAYRKHEGISPLAQKFLEITCDIVRHSPYLSVEAAEL